MPEGSWDLVPDKERTVENIATFILICEDKVNEPSYFQALQKEKKVKINFVEDSKSDHLNLLHSVNYCVENGLMEPWQGHYRIRPDVTEHVWSVYDRDAESEDKSSLTLLHQQRFSQAISSAQNAGLKVAWSNDVFELWILLHFENIAPHVWRHRSYVYERLTNIFRSLPDQSAEMSALTSHPRFSYKEAMKRRINFVNFVSPLLPPRQEAAIDRAKELAANYADTTPFYERNPCTMVYQLVESIRSFY